MRWKTSCATVTFGCMALAAAARPAGAEPHSFTFEELPTAAEMAFAYEHLRPMSARFHDQEEQAQPTDGQNREPSDGQPKTPASPPNTGMHPVAKGALYGTVAGFSAGCITAISHDDEVYGPLVGLVFALPGSAIGAVIGWLSR